MEIDIWKYTPFNFKSQVFEEKDKINYTSLEKNWAYSLGAEHYIRIVETAVRIRLGPL